MPPLPENSRQDVATALRDADMRLRATSDTARLDAEVLMAHALDTSRSRMLLHHMRDPAPDSFTALVERRLRHEPVAYITGAAEFYGLELAVSPAVLIPRGDSETLIEAAREAFATQPPASVLDLGTGSGALLIAALSLFPDACGLGLDRSQAALDIAARNAEQVHDRAELRCLDWTIEGWKQGLGQFDLILANPPYVEDDAALSPSVREFEPSGALFAGPDGLDDYRILLPQLPELLTVRGLALVEIGYRQANAVMALGDDQGLASQLHHDLAGRPRAIAFSRLLHR